MCIGRPSFWLGTGPSLLLVQSLAHIAHCRMSGQRMARGCTDSVAARLLLTGPCEHVHGRRRCSRRRRRPLLQPLGQRCCRSALHQPVSSARDPRKPCRSRLWCAWLMRNGHSCWRHSYSRNSALLQRSSPQHKPAVPCKLLTALSHAPRAQGMRRALQPHQAAALAPQLQARPLLRPTTPQAPRRAHPRADSCPQGLPGLRQRRPRAGTAASAAPWRTRRRRWRCSTGRSSAPWPRPT